MSALDWEMLSRISIPLITSFSGAGFAFLLNDRAKARQNVRDKVAAINRAQFMLIVQANELRNFRTKAIERFRDDPARHINIVPSPSFQDDSPTLDIDSLSFLLETNDRHLLFELMVERQRFREALKAINERSRIHLNEVQPILSKAGVREGNAYKSSVIVEALGESLHLSLHRATNDMIEHVDLSIDSSESLQERIYSAMKQRFRKHSIIYSQPVEMPGKSV